MACFVPRYVVVHRSEKLQISIYKKFCKIIKVIAQYFIYIFLYIKYSNILLK